MWKDDAILRYQNQIGETWTFTNLVMYAWATEEHEEAGLSKLAGIDTIA